MGVCVHETVRESENFICVRRGPPLLCRLLSSRADLFVLSASFCMGLEKGLSSLCGSSPELDLGATWNSSPSSSVMSSGHVHAWLWQRHDFSDVKLHVIGAAGEC